MRTLPQFSCTKSRIALDSSSLAVCSTGTASTGSSLRLATILRRFGAGPGCGGPPHCTVLLCRSRFRSLVNDLRHTSQTKGLGLQPLACPARESASACRTFMHRDRCCCGGGRWSSSGRYLEDCSDWTNLER